MRDQELACILDSLFYKKGLIMNCLFKTVILLWLISVTTPIVMAGYTGPSLKLPMKPGNKIFCTVETGGEYFANNEKDEWHTDARNGYYALDFDNRYSGDLVVAAASGTVIDLVNSGCYNDGPACYVKLDHGGDYVTVYYHLESGSIPSSVSVGTKVQQGQVIGTIGNTGYSTGPHLHLEVRVSGRRNNPLGYTR